MATSYSGGQFSPDSLLLYSCNHHVTKFIKILVFFCWHRMMMLFLGLSGSLSQHRLSANSVVLNNRIRNMTWSCGAMTASYVLPRCTGPELLFFRWKKTCLFGWDPIKCQIITSCDTKIIFPNNRIAYHNSNISFYLTADCVTNNGTTFPRHDLWENDLPSQKNTVSSSHSGLYDL